MGLMFLMRFDYFIIIMGSGGVLVGSLGYWGIGVLGYWFRDENRYVAIIRSSL